MSESKSDNQKNAVAAQRRKARSLALQALYQWQIAGAAVYEIEAEFVVDNDMSKVDVEYFRDLLRGVVSRAPELDEHFSALVNRPVEKIDPIEKALLRMGIYELKYRVDVPYRVVINEAIDLAKKFGGTDGHKFVNGILDKVAPRLRSAERGKR